MEEGNASKMLANQVRETDLALAKLRLPKHAWKNAVLIGMGGSALGAHVVQSLFAHKLRVPFEWRNSYSIPGYANEDTLVILSSYSGTTEEVIVAYGEAMKRGTGMVVLSSGGELAGKAERDGIPLVKFSTTANPDNQPRNGVGYNLVGVLGILEVAGVLPRAARTHTTIEKAFARAAALHRNEILAKKLARHVQGNIIGLAASEHLEGNLHIFQNQLHESAKHFAFFDTISELNHHLMEGLKHPKSFAKNLSMIVFASSQYAKKIQKRYPLTVEVFKKQGVKVELVELAGRNRLEDVAEMLVIGTQVSSELAKRDHENPNLIPWVDFFKKKLRGRVSE